MAQRVVTKGASISRVMRNFEFALVRRTMLRLDWKWAGVKGTNDLLAVPQESDIRKAARRMLGDVWMQPNGYSRVEMGGLCAEFIVDYGIPTLYLYFVLTQSTSE